MEYNEKNLMLDSLKKENKKFTVLLYSTTRNGDIANIFYQKWKKFFL